MQARRKNRVSTFLCRTEDTMSLYTKFRDLRIGDRFEFTSGLFAGPFRKTSARKYSHEVTGQMYTVGSINVAVDKIDTK
jgi:hypothetical protein